MEKSPTQRVIAKALKVSQQRVAQLAAAGMPTSSIAEAKAWRAGHSDPAKVKAPSSGLAGLQARKLAAATARAERENLIAEGKLLWKHEVEHAVAGIAARIVQRLENITEQLPLELGRDDEQRSAFRRRLREEFDRVRHEFAADVAAKHGA